MSAKQAAIVDKIYVAAAEPFGEQQQGLDFVEDDRDDAPLPYLEDDIPF